MKRFLCGLILTAALTFGQNAEAGAVFGGGVIAAPDVPATGAIAVGAEVCALCSRSFGVFAEYAHLESAGSRRSTGIARFDLIGGGLRIQGGERVRPFFDVGVAYGVDSFQYFGGSDSHGNVGMVLAGGVGIRMKERMYLRPQFRLYALRGIHVVAAGTIGVGIRF